MEIKRFFQWIFVFALLSVTTVSILQPSRGNAKEVLAYTAKTNSAALIVRHNQLDEIDTNIVRRILTHLAPRNLVCSVNQTQTADLSSRYVTDIETMDVDGQDITVFKIKNERNVNSATILRYLRSSGDEPYCIIVPSRTWYVAIFTGSVS